MPGRPITAALALTALWLGPPAAEARPQPIGQGTIITDDARYALLFPKSGGPSTLIDTSTGARRQITAPPGYTIGFSNGGIGGGQLMFEGGLSDPPLLMDIETGLTREPAGWASVEAYVERFKGLFVSAEAYAVGSQWIALSFGGLHFSEGGYLNWRTGEWPGAGPRDNFTRVNLDLPDLYEPSCPASEHRVFRRGRRVLIARCGSFHHNTLFRELKSLCDNCYSHDSDGNSLLPWRPVWVGRGRMAPIRAYLPRKRRTVALARMRRGPVNEGIRIAQTRTWVFVTIRDERVYWLPAPRG